MNTLSDHIQIFDDGIRLRIVRQNGIHHRTLHAFNKNAANFDAINAYIWSSESTFVSGHRKKQYIPIYGVSLADHINRYGDISTVLKKRHLSNCVFIAKTLTGNAFAIFVNKNSSKVVTNIDEYVHELTTVPHLFCGEIFTVDKSMHEFDLNQCIRIAEKKAIAFVKHYQHKQRQYDFLFL